MEKFKDINRDNITPAMTVKILGKMVIGTAAQAGGLVVGTAKALAVNSAKAEEGSFRKALLANSVASQYKLREIQAYDLFDDLISNDDTVTETKESMEQAIKDAEARKAERAREDERTNVVS